MPTKLILVGGFLGAGKTTLLAEAAKRLAARDLRVGLITNDQAPNLVDTALLVNEQHPVAEVNGSCFCCNFPGLVSAIDELRSKATPDTVIAEPVGSCTDLSATIVQPLKDLHADTISLAPLSVVADPTRLRQLLDGSNGDLHPSAAYILRKQLEEADVIVINKIDTLPAEEIAELQAATARAFPGINVVTLSARTGEGVSAWLENALSQRESGRRIVEVDYDTYAEGEAVLGWLNATFGLHGVSANWNAVATKLMESLSAQFDSRNASVGHVKLMIESGEEVVVANLTGTHETLSVRGPSLVASHATLTVNARVEMSPADLDQIVREALDAVSNGNFKFETVAWRSLSPGRPLPTHRYSQLVALN